MITLYGSPKSSAGRCIWTLEEAGVPYTLKELDFKNREHKSPDFLKINPNGKIPALADGNFTLFESMAINSYIAESYKKELLGKDVKERALVNQWSFWAISELQPPIIEVFIQKIFVPEERRDHKSIEENSKFLPELFTVLNNSLQGKKYLAGDDFTLADINVATVAGIAMPIGFNLSSYSNVENWLRNMSERPAYQKYMGMRNK